MPRTPVQSWRLKTRKHVISTRHGGGGQLSCLGEVLITWDLLRGAYNNLLGLELGCKTAPYSSGGSSIVSSYTEKAKRASEFLKGSQDLSDAGEAQLANPGGPGSHL